MVFYVYVLEAHADHVALLLRDDHHAGPVPVYAERAPVHAGLYGDGEVCIDALVPSVNLPYRSQLRDGFLGEFPELVLTLVEYEFSSYIGR